MGQNDAKKKTTSKVINMFDFRSEKIEKEKPSTGPSFEQLMEKNRKNQERLRSERNKANLSVIRGQQLKK